MEAELSDISVDISCSVGDPDLSLERIEDLARRICVRFGLAPVRVGIAIVDDEQIRRVHQRFLGRSVTTDVISFDLSDPDETAASFELVVNAEEARRQGERRGHGTEAELALYVTHGLLHQVGWDDTDAHSARQMHTMEDEILQQAGFGIVYHNQPAGSKTSNRERKG